MIKNTFTILFAAILITGCSLTTQATQVPTTLNIRAYIDGRSQLIITADAVYWHHLDFEAPGRWEFREKDQPTYLNRVEWEPIWPDVPDPTNDFCNCNSSIYKGIPSLARTDQRIWLDIVRGRGRIIVFQQPNEKNNYTLIIEMDDNSFDGAAWYEVNLNYVVGNTKAVSISTLTPVVIMPPSSSLLSSISGNILLETNDPFLRIYARDINTGEIYSVNPGTGNPTYTIPNLPPGTYVVVGWFHPMGASGAYTSLNTVIAETEGQQRACEEAIIEIQLESDEAFDGADIGCWGGDFFDLTQ
jgi:hypothetical protein